MCNGFEHPLGVRDVTVNFGSVGRVLKHIVSMIAIEFQFAVMVFNISCGLTATWTIIKRERVLNVVNVGSSREITILLINNMMDVW